MLTVSLFKSFHFGGFNEGHFLPYVTFTVNTVLITMALTFETTHEYYVRDASIYYCNEHEALIVTRDHEDRLLINGVDHETMLKFARKLIQEDLDKCLAKYEDKEVNKEDKEVNV